jgi:hypothetical protein
VRGIYFPPPEPAGVLRRCHETPEAQRPPSPSRTGSKKKGLIPAETQEFIDPIEKGMFVELQSIEDYEQLLASNGLQIMHREVLNRSCAKTWDLGLEIIKDKRFWTLAAKHGTHFVSYLKAFQATRAGFASGNFVYGLLVASAISNV